MDAVGADDDGAALGAFFAVGGDEMQDRLVAVVVETRHGPAGLNAVRSRALDQRAIKHHVQQAAVHRILRPAIARPKAARLGPDFQALLGIHAVVAGADADVFKPLFEAEGEQFTHRARLQIDADAERPYFAHAFEDADLQADLMAGERNRETCDAAACDEYRHIAPLAF